MKKKEKNDTDVFITKEENWKKEKRNCSKYYAKKRIRKAFRRKAPTFKEESGETAIGQNVQKLEEEIKETTFGQNVQKPEEVKETTIGQNAQKLEEEVEEAAFGQNVQKSEEEVKEIAIRQNVQKSIKEEKESAFRQNVQKSVEKEQGTIFGQSVSKSVEAKEEERKSRNKRIVRKENERRKKEKEGNISQTEKLSSPEKKIKEVAGSNIFEQEKDIVYVTKSNGGKEEVSGSRENTLKRAGDVISEPVNVMEVSVENGSELLTNTAMKSNVGKAEDAAGAFILGQNIPKVDVENRGTTFGQGDLKSVETKEEERKSRNKRIVRKESERRKKEKEGNISQTEKLSFTEKRTMELSGSEVFKNKKDKEFISESNAGKREIPEVVEDALKQEFNAKSEPLNAREVSMESKQEVSTNIPMKSSIGKQGYTGHDFAYEQSTLKSDKETEETTFRQNVQKSVTEKLGRTFGQNVPKSAKTKAEERKSRHKKRIQKEIERQKQKKEATEAIENTLKHELNVKSGNTNEMEVSAKRKQEFPTSDVSEAFNERKEDIDDDFISEADIRRNDKEAEENTFRQNALKSSTQKQERTFGQNVLKSVENKETLKKEQDKKRIRRETEKRRETKENSLWRNRDVIFQEKRTIEFTDVNKDEEKKEKVFHRSEKAESPCNKKDSMERIFANKSGKANAVKLSVTDTKRDSADVTMKRTKEKTADAEYTLEQVFDEESGKNRYVVVPVKRKKQFSSDAVLNTVMRKGKNVSMEVLREQTKDEDEEDGNAATEGCYQITQNTDRTFSLIRGIRDFHKSDEKKHFSFFQKEEDTRRSREQNLYQEKEQGKAFQKKVQKRQRKREYAKAIRKVVAERNLSEVVLQSRNYAIMVARKMQKTSVEYAGVFIALGISLLLVVMIMTSVSSCGAVFADIQTTVLAAAYQSKPGEIDATDLQFTRLELNLQKEIDNIERTHSGYDEYVYNLGSIGHNPYILVSYLSAVYGEFLAEDVKREVENLFEEMYRLSLQAYTETRKKEIYLRDDYGNLLYDEYGNILTFEVEYEVRVLKVTLTVTSLETIVGRKMNQEQKEFYDLYRETGGLLQVFDSPLEEKWHPNISSFYGYRKNPISGAEQIHRGVDIAVPTGTNVYAAHDGRVIQAGYDSSYGNYVVIEQDGYVTKYAHMHSLHVRAGQAIEKNTVIGTSGNTGNSTGSHLHIECMYNGEYYNPLFYFENGM